MAKLSIKKVKEALVGSIGNYSTIAQKCAVDRSAITYFFKHHPDIKELADAEKDKLVDVAENQVAIKIRDGDIKTCMWFLDTRGRDRGYGQKLSLDGEFKVGCDIQVIIPKEVEELLNESLSNS